MKNVGLLAAGLLGAAVLTTGIGFALSKSDNRAPMEFAERDSAPAGMSEAEMDARIADERAAADARVADAEARAQAKINCEKARQNASNTGAVVGGVTGAVIGTQVAGSGAKSEGGVIGGVAGVLAGRQIARDQNRSYRHVT
jgi:uncharacterized protein YcfJ